MATKMIIFSFIPAMKEPWVWNLWLRMKIVETVTTQPRLASRNVPTGASATRHWWNRAYCKEAGKNHAKIPTGAFSFLTILWIYSTWHFEGLPSCWLFLAVSTLTFMFFSDNYSRTWRPTDIMFISMNVLNFILFLTLESRKLCDMSNHLVLCLCVK